MRKFLFIEVDLSNVVASLRFMTLRRSVIAFYALLFVALTLFAALFFLRTYGEYAALKSAEVKQRQSLAQAQSNLTEKTTILRRLRSDPAFVKRTLREHLGYAEPGEVVFRFEQ